MIRVVVKNGKFEAIVEQSKELEEWKDVIEKFNINVNPIEQLKNGVIEYHHSRNLLKSGEFYIEDNTLEALLNYDIITIEEIYESCMVHEKEDVGVYLLTLGKLPDEDYLNDNPEVKKYVDKLKNKLNL
jgi:hypothetical protein